VRQTERQTDRQTDGQTDGIAVASTALVMRALRRAVITAFVRTIIGWHNYELNLKSIVITVV